MSFMSETLLIVTSQVTLLGEPVLAARRFSGDSSVIFGCNFEGNQLMSVHEQCVFMSQECPFY